MMLFRDQKDCELVEVENQFKRLLEDKDQKIEELETAIKKLSTTTKLSGSESQSLSKVLDSFKGYSKISL